MTGSNSRRLAVASFCLLAVLQAAAMAAAPAPAPPPLVPPGAAAPPPPSVAVDSLAAPRPDAIGLVGAASGGFSDTLWRGTPADAAQALVTGLPHRYLALAARQLAQRFLLSGAPIDGGGAGDAARGMLDARIAALAAMADWDDVLALTDLVPVQSRSPALIHTRVNGLLARGRVDAACAEALSPEQNTDPFWQELPVLCQLTVGQNSAANVNIALLREQGGGDKAFFWAVDNSDVAPPADLVRADGSVDPLILALMRRNARLVPEAVVRRGDPTVLMVAAEIAAAPPPPAPPPEDEPAKPKHGKAKKSAEKPLRPDTHEELRLMTIERAVAAGVADADVLRAAYSAQPISTDESASTDHIAVGKARDRAATYQLAIAQSMPASRAEVIARAFDLSRLTPAGEGPNLTATALIYSPNVAAMAPTIDVAWFGGTAVRILAAAATATPGGNTLTATRPWIELLDTIGTTSKDVAAVRAGIWPYLRLMAPTSGALAHDDIAAWQASLPAEPPLRATMLRADALDLMAGVGDAPAATDWQGVLVAMPDPPVQSAALPAMALWDMLNLAAREGRVGETVALALRLLGADGGPPSQLAITTGLNSLTAVARNSDARAIAIEVALERGL